MVSGDCPTVLSHGAKGQPLKEFEMKGITRIRISGGRHAEGTPNLHIQGCFNIPATS